MPQGTQSAVKSLEEVIIIPERMMGQKVLEEELAGEEGSCFVASFQFQETGWNQHRTHCGEMPNQTLEHGRLEAFESKSLTVKGFSRGAPFQRSAAQSLFPSGT